VVQIQGEDRDYGQIMAHRRIIRPPHRKPYLGPLKMTMTGESVSEGRMVGLLPVSGTVQ
jgi:hypothetical protein